MDSNKENLQEKTPILTRFSRADVQMSQVGLTHKFPIGLQYIPDLRFRLLNEYAIYSGFLIDSSLDIDIIDRISLRSECQDSTNTIVEISGFAMRIQRILTGKDKSYGIVHLPFPIINLLQYHSVEVVVSFKNPKQIIDMIMAILTRRVDYWIAKIIWEYTFSQCSIELWANLRAQLTNKLPKEIKPYFVQYHEEQRYIEKNATTLSVYLHLIGAVHKIVLVFFRADDIYQTPIDMLESGILDEYPSNPIRFTGRSLHIHDKVLAGNYVSNEPVYTITFDSDPLNTESNLPHSHKIFTFETRLIFTLNVVPQMHSTTLHIICEKTAQLLTHDYGLYVKKLPDY